MRRFLFLLALLLSPSLYAQDTIVLQSTTSTANSGLLDHILPIFEAETGLEVQVVAVGTGQAIRNAENGDGDLLLVHARAREEAFVAQGWGLVRHEFMYNDFVIVGPQDDPAGISGLTDVSQALTQIDRTRSVFISRGDQSGTHIRELSLWAQTGQGAPPSARFYRESGSGMGATLNMAVALGAYTLSDRGTWLAFGNKADFRVLVEGDARLFNPYSLIAVNPERHPHVNLAGAQALIDWLTGPRGQAEIGAYRLEGQQLFVPLLALD